MEIRLTKPTIHYNRLQIRVETPEKRATLSFLRDEDVLYTSEHTFGDILTFDVKDLKGETKPICRN